MQYVDKVVIQEDRVLEVPSITFKLSPGMSDIFHLMSVNDELIGFSERYSTLFENGPPQEIEVDSISYSNIGHYQKVKFSSCLTKLSEPLYKSITNSISKESIHYFVLDTELEFFSIKKVRSQYLTTLEIRFNNTPGIFSSIIRYLTESDLKITSSILFKADNLQELAKLKIDLSSDKPLNEYEHFQTKRPECIKAWEVKNIFKSSLRIDQLEKPYEKVFISYSSVDKAFAKKLVKRIEELGIDFWFDEKEFIPGEKITDKISQGIQSCEKFILICSKNSLSSWWVDLELDQALLKESKAKGNFLIPISLDDAIFDPKFAYHKRLTLLSRHIGDFTNWDNAEDFEKSFSLLLKACEKVQ